MLSQTKGKYFSLVAGVVGKNKVKWRLVTCVNSSQKALDTARCDSLTRIFNTSKNSLQALKLARRNTNNLCKTIFPRDLTATDDTTNWF